MNKRTMLVGLALLVIPAGVAVANPIAFHCIGTPPEGSAAVFFDATGTVACRDLMPSVPFDYYVVARNLEGDLSAYEFSVNTDPRVTIMGRTYHPATGVDVGVGDDNWIVDAGECVSGTGPVVLISMVGVLLAAADDVLLCMEPSTPSTSDPPEAGYANCPPDVVWRPFGRAIWGLGLYPDNCAVGNSTEEDWEWGVIPIPERSWGEVKARFGT